MSNNTSKARKRTYVIYLIQINGTSYVGQTSSYKNRKRDHISALRRGKHHNIHLQRAYDKYGDNSVEWSILERCTQKQSDYREKHWISFFNSYENGFNQNEGGENTFGKSCVWNGIAYPSLSAAAEANNCSTTTMQRRLSAGWTCDGEVPEKGFRIPVIWNGIEYPSINECSRQTGRGSESIRYCLENGITCDEDVPEHAEWSRKALIWNGIKYPSRAECSRQTGIPTTTLTQYLQRGYICDEDIPPSRVKLDMQKAEHIRQLHSTGKWDYGQLAKQYGVSKATIGLIVSNKIWRNE